MHANCGPHHADCAPHQAALLAFSNVLERRWTDTGTLIATDDLPCMQVLTTAWLLDSGLTSSAADAPNTALKGDKSSPSKASPFGNKALQGAWLGEKEKGARRISTLAYCAERC